MHRKKILAVAVAGALGMASAGVAVAAGGAESSYTIYGRLFPQISSYDYDGATLSGTTGGSDLVPAPTATANHSQRSSLDVNNSRIGFRGSEGLGGGLRAIFQIEQRVRFDNGTGIWANRNSFVGLTGGFGTFKLGNHDTAYKLVRERGFFFGVSGGNFVSSQNLLSEGPGDGVAFNLRQPNNMVYESPKFAGVQVLASWGKDELKSSPGTGRSTNILVNSYAVTWESGPVRLAAGHEIHKDFFSGSNSFAAVDNPTTGANVRSTDTATRVIGTLKLGGTKLYLEGVQIELKETGVIAAGNFASYKNQRRAAGVEHKFGNITGAFMIVDATQGTCTLGGGAACSTTGLEGRLMNLGANYDFSKRTAVFAIYSKLTNGSSASFSNIAINANPNGAADPQPGEDVTAIGVGVSHSF